MSELSNTALAPIEVSRSVQEISPARAVLTPASLLARNAILNFLAEAWTLLVLLVAMPKLVSAWGETSFGLFSLAWVVIGYLSFLDIGVNRAATKFISEHLASDEHDSVCSLVRTSLWTNLILGLLGGLFVLLLSPYLIHSILKISGPLQHEARLVFYGVALAVPVLLVQGIFRAVLSSYQHFGWINGVNAVMMTMQWGAAVLLSWKGNGVAIVVLATVIARFAGTLVYGMLLRRLLPALRLLKMRGPTGLFKLLKFGSWVSVSQVISPLLVYLDRMLIASFVSLGAVTLYTVPFEAMTRLRIVPTSLVNTLFPAFSERGIDGHEAQLQNLYEGSVRYLLILTMPFLIVLTVLGHDVLAVWMGTEFANKASSILEILSFGVLLNCMATIPYNALQALGRPDLTAKFHLLELPVYFVLCISLIPHWGIAGAAIASTVRFAMDAGLLFWAAAKHYRLRIARTLGLVHALVLNFGIAVGLMLARVEFSSILARVSCGVFACLIYAIACWTVLMSDQEKPRVISALRVLLGHTPA